VTTDPLFDLDPEPPAPDLQAFAARWSVLPPVAPAWGSAGEAAHLAAECDPASCPACARAEAMKPTDGGRVSRPGHEGETDR
jgi:hypothetical protein